jgi:hypothetical protein
MTQEICKHLAAGMGRVDSCILSDIHYDTFCEWMKRAEFSEAIKKAEASCKERNIALIQRAATKSWQAAAWTLERKYPMEFGIKMAHSNADGTPLNLHSSLVLLIQHSKEGHNGTTIPAVTSTPTEQIGSCTAA